jgi:bifunctional DNase/RNase
VLGSVIALLPVRTEFIMIGPGNADPLMLEGRQHPNVLPITIVSWEGQAIGGRSLVAVLRKRPLIVDLTLVNMELDMLEFRMRTLNEVVDIFVVGESPFTFSGLSKPLYFDDSRRRFEPYLHKIRHVVIDDSPNDANAWVNEGYQRNALARGLSGLKLRPTDVIILADVDEVPDPETIQAMRRNATVLAGPDCGGMCSLSMDNYVFSWHFRRELKWDPWPKAMTYERYKNATRDDIGGLNKLRRNYDAPLLPLPGGWHLSYFGDVEFIKNKVRPLFVQRCDVFRYMLGSGRSALHPVGPTSWLTTSFHRWHPSLTTRRSTAHTSPTTPTSGRP